MKVHTKTVAFVLALLIGPAVGRAYAVSVRDLIELSKEGVSDAVLIALIETDGSRFKLAPAEIRDIRAQGLSDAVIVAMIRTRPVISAPRDGAAEAVLPDAEPVIAPRAPEPIIVQAPPVTVTQTVVQKVEVERPRREAQPVYYPVYVAVPVKVEEKKKEEPVYWGWGGQRRPDAWKEPVIIK